MLGTRKWTAQGRGEYAWQSYAQVERRLSNLGSGLLALGLKKGDMLGLYAANCADWVVGEQTCNAYSLVAVPLYDTLGPEAVDFILGQTEMPAVLAAPAMIKPLAKVAAGRPSLRYIIEMDGDASLGAPASGHPAASLADLQALASGSAPGLGGAGGALVLRMSDLEALGAAKPMPHVPPAASDVCTICYTSGTTGMPKGAILKHGNFAAGAAGAASAGVDLVPSDVHLSYLPLAHVFERLVQVALIRRGGSIGFYQGDVVKLVEDLGTLKPTLFPSVPRLWNRIYDKVMAGVREAGGVKAALFAYAYEAKKGFLPEGYTTHSLWDALVFNKVRALFGGRVRLMVTGSAPISSEVKSFLQVAFCAPVLEGYGLTETVGAATITPAGDFTNGHVGAPIACTELKLVDIPEMNYCARDEPQPRGEICLRGPNIFGGYFKNEAKTAEVIDEDGWFHTGDVGRINSNGTVCIIDRKKNIFKLSQGEYVAPEKVEGVLGRAPLVAQSWVYGDSLQSSLLAFIVVDPDVAASWAAGKGAAVGSTLEAWVQSDALLAEVRRQLQEVQDAAKLKGFERPKGIKLLAEPFSVENGLLTPTFKLKRPQLKARYGGDIDMLYAGTGASSAGSGAAAQ